MKIIYHHRTQAEDAQGIHIYEMIHAFEKIGHSVKLVSLVKLDGNRSQKIKGRYWECVAKIVPNFVYELLELTYNIVGYFLLSSQIKKERPDFIYERYSLHTFCGILASRKYRIPLVLEVNAPLYHEQLKLEKLSFSKLAKFSEKWICSNSYKTIVVSKVLKNILVNEGVPDDHIVVIPNGINPAEFNEKISGNEIRNHYHIGMTKVVLGFVGWFRPWHGLDTILTIINKEKLFSKGVHILFCGDGPAYQQLSEYVRLNNLHDFVTFTGPLDRDDVPRYIAAFDVALQPSATSYASPMKIFEYLAMGKGVIAPDQENMNEILTADTDSIMFARNDMIALQECLVRVVEDDRLRDAIGKNALRTIKEGKYFWEENAKRVIAALPFDKCL